MKVTIIVPVLDRVNNIVPLVKSIVNSTKDFEIHFVCSPGFIYEMKTIAEEVPQILHDNWKLSVVDWPPGPGDYARKINRAASESNSDWIFTGADDLQFHPFWLDNAITKAGTQYHVIGTQDMGNPRVIAGNHATHFLVRNSYFKKIGCSADNIPGELFCTQYWHEGVDDELVGVSVSRDIYTFCHSSLVEHLHPNWGKGNIDASYSQQNQRIRYGQRILYQRRNKWSGKHALAYWEI